MVGLMAGLLGCAASPAIAAECDPTALVTVRNFLDARDGRAYRESQRYLSSGFGQSFRNAYGAAYLDYMGDPDVTWRQSAIQSSSVAPGQCTVLVSSTRDAGGASSAATETYTLVETYQGWRIGSWQWQPAQ